MVIIKTRATDVSIHAVSPEFGVHFSRILPPQAGGESSANAGLPSASQRSATPNSATMNTTSLWRPSFPDSIVVLLVPDVSSVLSVRAFQSSWFSSGRRRTGRAGKANRLAFLGACADRKLGEGAASLPITRATTALL